MFGTMFKLRNIDKFKLLRGRPKTNRYVLGVDPAVMGGESMSFMSNITMLIHRGDGVLEHVTTRNPCREIVLENFRIERS